MIVHFDKYGRLLERVTDYELSDGTQSFDATAGNYGANSIYAIFDSLQEATASTESLTITYKMPSGQRFVPYDIECSGEENLSIVFDQKRDLRTLSYGKEYLMRRFDFPDGLISEGGDGAYSATIRRSSGGIIMAFGLITFAVKEGVQADDSYVTTSNFDYLVSRIGGLSDQYVTLDTEQTISARKWFSANPMAEAYGATADSGKTYTLYGNGTISIKSSDGSERSVALPNGSGTLALDSGLPTGMIAQKETSGDIGLYLSHGGTAIEGQTPTLLSSETFALEDGKIVSLGGGGATSSIPDSDIDSLFNA